MLQSGRHELQSDARSDNWELRHSVVGPAIRYLDAECLNRWSIWVKIFAMPVYGIIAGFIAWLLLTLVGASFMIAPEKANEWFGTMETQRENPGVLRLGGLLFIFAVFFIGLMIVEAVTKL